MQDEFQEKYYGQVMPALIGMLNDPVPRVQAHACACLNNFLEGCSEEIAQIYISALAEKFYVLIQNGISIIKENAVTALASLAEASKKYFEPYFDECIRFLISLLP